MNLPSTTKFYQAVIVGAGPVGLFHACCLQAWGLSYLFLERRKERRSSGRVLTLFPATLELLGRMGLVEPVLAAGRRVASGRVFSGPRCLSHANIESLPPPYNYLLTVPQFDFERILEEHLERFSPDLLFRNAHVVSFQNGMASVGIRARIGVRTVDLNTGFLIGTDGPNSMVRTGTGIEFETNPAGDFFAVGDFDDVGGFGDETRIYLDDQGFIESLPLPRQQRRWVVQMPALMKNPDETAFIASVRERTGVDLAGRHMGILTAVGISRYVASTFHKGRAALAGDAAHVMTPIGGRGFQAGLLDAYDLAGVVHHVAQAKAVPDLELAQYTQRGMARVRAINQWEAHSYEPGRGGRKPWLQAVGAKMGLLSGKKPAVADYFGVKG